MEKWCILPNNLVKELTKEDNKVFSSLCRFCKCTKEELMDILQKRNESESYLAYWYKVQRRKIKDKTRSIKIPYDTLGKIQDTIKERLSYIPVSLCATWGKPGDSVEKNIEPHRYNPYMINLDIKDAYPSIDTHRVYKHLQWTLNKPLKYWCPLLEKEEEKDLFIRTITHLCMHQNQLPQGASTSNQIQNIVMSSFDTKIEKKLPELGWSQIVYSRYADDMTISFPHFSTLDVLKEKMEKYIQECDIKFWDEKAKEKFSQIVNEFTQDTFILTDAFEFSYLQDKIERMKFLIDVNFDIKRNEKEDLIWRLNTFKKNIKYSGRRITDIQKEIIDIIGENWFKVNTKKTEFWTPQSNTDREINGISLDSEWNKGLNRKKKSAYKRFFEDMATASVNDLWSNNYYRYKFKIEFGSDSCATSIISTLKWYYAYISKVYSEGKIPKDLEIEYQKAIKKRSTNPEIEETKWKWDLSADKTSNQNKEFEDDIPF